MAKKERRSITHAHMYTHNPRAQSRVISKAFRNLSGVPSGSAREESARRKIGDTWRRKGVESRAEDEGARAQDEEEKEEEEEEEEYRDITEATKRTRSAIHD